MPKIPQNFIPTIKYLAEVLKGYQYAIRGTASLVLQNYDMNVDDIDILADASTALAFDSLCGVCRVSPCTGSHPAQGLTLQRVEYRESPKFKSYYGKYEINGIQVEIMGEWKILGPKNSWGTPFDASERQPIAVEGTEVWVTTVESELKMYQQMGRWTAYHKVLRQYKEKNYDKLADLERK